MGHTRLGPLPKSKRWEQVVATLTGSELVGYAIPSAATQVNRIAAQALSGARKTLAKATDDAGVRYTFYLLTQLVLASRRADWQKALEHHGIELTPDSNVFDLTAEIQNAIDRHVSGTKRGTTDVGEMAQQAAGETLISLLSADTADLFGDKDPTRLKNSVRSLSTSKGFGKLGQHFFARFVAKFLNFHLSRATAAGLGTPRLRNLGDIAEFDAALSTHCEESAVIVRDFCRGWYSKTEYEHGINLENTSRFLAIAVRKLQRELQQQGRVS